MALCSSCEQPQHQRDRQVLLSEEQMPALMWPALFAWEVWGFVFVKFLSHQPSSNRSLMPGPLMAGCGMVAEQLGVAPIASSTWHPDSQVPLVVTLTVWSDVDPPGLAEEHGSVPILWCLLMCAEELLGAGSHLSVPVGPPLPSTSWVARKGKSYCDRFLVLRGFCRRGEKEKLGNMCGFKLCQL